MDIVRLNGLAADTTKWRKTANEIM